MSGIIERSYYALVFNTSLKKRDKIRGKLIDKNTKLPKDGNILYGTNDNDKLKIKAVNYENEIHYDAKTTMQSVRFKILEDVVEIPRDVRIIIWKDNEYLDPRKDKYKIVSPQHFEEMISYKKHTAKDLKFIERFRAEEILASLDVEDEEFDEYLEIVENLEFEDDEVEDFQFEIFNDSLERLARSAS